MIPHFTFRFFHSSNTRRFLKQVITLVIISAMLPVAIECSSSRSQGSQRSEDKKGSPGDTLKNIDIRTYPSVGRALERRTNPHNGYGYDIYINGKLYVHQPYMQGGDNNTPFPSEEGAKMTADFLIFKLKKHIIPPTVSQAEVDSLITR